MRFVHYVEEGDELIYRKRSVPTDDKVKNQIQWEDWEAAWEAGYHDSASMAMYVCSVRVDACRAYPMMSIRWIKVMRSLLHDLQHIQRSEWREVIRNHEAAHAHQAAVWADWAKENGYSLKSVS